LALGSSGKVHLPNGTQHLNHLDLMNSTEVVAADIVSKQVVAARDLIIRRCEAERGGT
jgi:hypothetical protein